MCSPDAIPLTGGSLSPRDLVNLVQTPIARSCQTNPMFSARSYTYFFKIFILILCLCATFRMRLTRGPVIYVLWFVCTFYEDLRRLGLRAEVRDRVWAVVCNPADLVFSLSPPFLQSNKWSFALILHQNCHQYQDPFKVLHFPWSTFSIKYGSHSKTNIG